MWILVSTTVELGGRRNMDGPDVYSSKITTEIFCGIFYRNCEICRFWAATGPKPKPEQRPDFLHPGCAPGGIASLSRPAAAAAPAELSSGLGALEQDFALDGDLGSLSLSLSLHTLGPSEGSRPEGRESPILCAPKSLSLSLPPSPLLKREFFLGNAS